MTTTPSPSPFCTHPDDEWCDGCVLDVWHRQMLAVLDAEPTEPEALLSRVPCQNQRHAHQLAHGARCFPLVDQDKPLPDRVLGTALIIGVTAIGVTLAASVAAGEWANTVGRLHVRAAAQRAHDAWCRTAG